MKDDDKIEDKLIEYLNDSLSKEEAEELKGEISNSADLQNKLKEFEIVHMALGKVQMREVPSKVHNDFNQFLLNEIAAENENKISIESSEIAKPRFIKPIAMAMICILLIVIVALMIKNENENEASNLSEEIANLRIEMLQLLEEERSTSGRIKAVNISYEIPQPDEEIIDALILAMNSDKSDNVRLSAIEALYDNYVDSPKVKTAFCKALNQQENPVIQSRIIEMLVGFKEKKYGKYLKEFVNAEDILQDIRDQAHMGIMQMM